MYFSPGVGSWGCTDYVSVSWDVPSEGVQFSKSVSDGGIFHCTNSEKGLKYTCYGKGSLLVWKRVVKVTFA